MHQASRGKNDFDQLSDQKSEGTRTARDGLWASQAAERVLCEGERRGLLSRRRRMLTSYERNPVYMGVSDSGFSGWNQITFGGEHPHSNKLGLIKGAQLWVFRKSRSGPGA